MSRLRRSSIFLADAHGLDFLNALSPAEHQKVAPLTSGGDLVAWLADAGLALATDLERAFADIAPEALDAVARDAVSLGAWFRGFVMAHKGRKLTAECLAQLEPLNRLLETDAKFTQVDAPQGDVDGGPRLVWRVQRQWRSPQTLLLPIAEAMSSLICESDFSAIRQCEGCELLFLDRHRARSRRWCSMNTCGNRAKQAILHRRQAGRGAR